MKKYLSIFLAALMFASVGCISRQATEVQEKSLLEVKEFPGMTKNYLYNKSLSYIVRSYKSANDVIQLKDPDSGQIICKGTGAVYDPLMVKKAFHYTFIIDLKDNKMRTRFENINALRTGSVPGADTSQQWDEISEYLNNIRNELYRSISSAKLSDNW